MSTNEQINANRQNALKSTGPKSVTGKQKVSKNAIKHGLCADLVVLPNENQEDFTKLVQQLFNCLSPCNVMEAQLVERIASSIWRLKRVGFIETQLFDYLMRLPSDPISNSYSYAKSFIQMSNKDYLAKLSRYERTIERAMYRALRELRDLRDPAKAFIEINLA